MMAVLFMNWPRSAIPEGPTIFEMILMEIKLATILNKVAKADQEETFTNSFFLRFSTRLRIALIRVD
jgi:hypothetical protein